VTAVLLGIGVFAAVFLLHLAFSHAVTVTRKERVLVAFVAAGGIVYTLVFVALHVPLASTLPVLLDYIAGACAYSFLGLGYLEFWSLIERSFSARILVDCAQAADTGLSADDIARVYGGGQGIDWMFEKRKQGLIGSGMIAPLGNGYRLSGRGRFFASLLHGLRSFFRVV